MKAPFPWFGGKARITPLVWQLLGDVPNFVEPFFGSGAVLLARPPWPDGEARIETVNDYDGLVCNFWRAVQADPDTVAHYADWPVNENDLHARHIWLVEHKDSLQARLEGDHDFFDAKIAGWWCWGLACWIGGGFCSGNGPWRVQEIDGVRQLVHLGNAGQGVQRRRVHLGNAGQGVQRRRVHLGDAGQGVQRRRVHLGSAGQGDAGNGEQGLYAWMQALAARLERVRVCCGDWTRVCGPTPTVKQGLTGMFLDPPYSAAAGRDNSIYRTEDTSVAHDVRRWCLEHGDDKRLRIVLCGYAGEGHEKLQRHGWRCIHWKAQGGMANQGKGNGNKNRHKERLWVSPHCLTAEKPNLFESVNA